MRKSLIAFFVVLVMLVSTQAVFAASNPDVTIVNPVSGNTLYSDNLLISVKLTNPTKIKVNVTQEFKMVNGTKAAITMEEYEKSISSPSESKIERASVSYLTTDTFTSANNLSFYTKKIENIKPGIYTINVQTLDGEDKVKNTNSSYVEIKPKDENPADPAAYENQQSGTTQLLKGLLKSIFGN